MYLQICPDLSLINKRIMAFPISSFAKLRFIQDAKHFVVVLAVIFSSLFSVKVTSFYIYLFWLLALA